MCETWCGSVCVYVKVCSCMCDGGECVTQCACVFVIVCRCMRDGGEYALVDVVVYVCL